MLKISSEVCTTCRKCCLIDKWDESFSNLEFIPFGHHNSFDTIPVRKFYDYGEYWLACSHLTKKGCSNYENRPLRCRTYNCLETFNITGNPSHDGQPHVNEEAIKLIIDKIQVQHL